MTLNRKHDDARLEIESHSLVFTPQSEWAEENAGISLKNSIRCLRWRRDYAGTTRRRHVHVTLAGARSASTPAADAKSREYNLGADKRQSTELSMSTALRCTVTGIFSDVMSACTEFLGIHVKGAGGLAAINNFAAINN
ncbi:hypothetical protein ACJJTC_003565 [Scirpophaga incertulas]